MAHRFVITDPQPDTSGEVPSQIVHLAFQIAIARAKHNHPAAIGDEFGHHLRQKVDALLVRHAADHNRQGTGHVHIKLGTQIGAVDGLAGHIGSGIGDGFQFGRPDTRIHPVQDPRHDRGPRADHPFQPQARFLPHQISGIGRRDSGYSITGDKPRLQAGQIAVVFQLAGMKLLARKAQIVDLARTGPALKGDVVDGHHRPHIALAAIGQVCRRKACMPIMAVQNIRLPAIARTVARDFCRNP